MTQRTLIPLLLVGLPVGLAISIVAALYLYYHPLDFPLPGRSKSKDSAALFRRSPNEDDLRDYRRILTTDLATRAAEDPARQRATANWITSTLGPTNFGLTVQSLTGGVPTEGWAGDSLPDSLVIEIPGSRLKNEIVLVVTAHHSGTDGVDDAVSTAVGMSLVGAFAGTPQRRTLVFGFLGRELADPDGLTPLDRLVQYLRLRGLHVAGVLDIRVGRPLPAPSDGSPRAGVLAAAPVDGHAWTGEVREAFAPRKPDTMSFDFVAPAAIPAAATSLAGWRSPPAPYVLVWLTPAAANDEASPLALARSLEGVLQALANR